MSQEPDTDALQEALRRRRQKLGQSMLGDSPEEKEDE